MTHQHRELAAGRWQELSLVERMANIGSEVERALNWRAKGNADYSERAFVRALELIDLSLAHPQKRSHIKEIARLREILADFFVGTNDFGSTEESFRRYFSHFYIAARRGS